MSATTLPNQLKTYRKKSHLGQDDLAFLLGLQHASEVSRHEHSTREPSLEAIFLYSHIFGVPAEKLFREIVKETLKKARNRIPQLIKELASKPASPQNKAKLEFLERRMMALEHPEYAEPARLQRPIRILGIDPAVRGFGFAVLEDNLELIDWGVIGCRGTTPAECLQKVEAVIERYQPSIIALENCKGSGSRRCHAVQHFLRAIAKKAVKHRIRIASYSPEEVRQVFSSEGATKKEEIAQVIARIFPELAPRLPKPRKGEGEPEDYRMTIFDAVALALTHLQR